MNIFQQDVRQTPKLFQLIRAGANAEAKRHLFWHPGELHLNGWMDDTPLHIAVAADNLEMVQYLVEKGAHVNASRSGSWPYPLNWSKSVEVASYLLDHGAVVNAQALEYATRTGVPSLIALLLDRGAKLYPQSPQYLHCPSIGAMQVYLDRGFSLDGEEDGGRNLLHHFVWGNMPAEFDFAYAHGVPWKKALGQNPYYFGKSGGRTEMMAHIRAQYPDLVAPTVKAIRPQEVHFRRVVSVLPSRDQAHVVFVWTFDDQLGRLEIHDGKWAVTTAVHVNVCEVWRMAEGPDGQLVLPTADGGLLVLDALTLELRKFVPLETGLDFSELIYMPGRGLYLGLIGNSDVCLLNPEFEVVARHSPVENAMALNLSPGEDLVSIWSSDIETFHVLYHLGLETEWAHVQTFYFQEKGRSLDLAFGANGFVVCFERSLVRYQWARGKVEEVWELPLAPYATPEVCAACIFVNEHRLIVGIGQKLLLVDAQIPEIIGVFTLDLDGVVSDLYLDGSKTFLIARGGCLDLLRLDAIAWESISYTND